MFRSFLTACLVGITCLPSFLPQAKGQTAVQAKVMLSGSVLDPNGAAIPAALIYITGNDSPSTIHCDQEGNFSVSLLAGDYVIRVTADGFTEAIQRVTLTGSNQPLLRFSLNVAAASAIVNIADSPAYGVPGVSSATRTFTPLRDTPQSISVVTKEQIRDQFITSVADVVNYVPGITSHQGENNRDQLVIRGNSTSADFFLNGVRDDVQYYRDLYNVQQVEALKGPNSMIFGRGGGGGVINRVTKQAGFSSLREISAEGGSFGNKRFTVDFDQVFGNKVAGRLNGVFEDSGSFRQYVDLQRYGINPTITLAPGTKTAITFSYEHLRDRRIADRGVPSFRGKPAASPLSTYFGDPNNSRVNATVNIGSAAVEQEWGRFTIRSRMLVANYERFYQNYVPGGVTSDKSCVAISAYNNASTRTNIFNQTDVNTSVSTDNIKHNLLTGFEFGRQYTKNFRNTGFFNNTAISIQVPYDNPTMKTPITFRQTGNDANNHVTAKLAAAYLQDQIELSQRILIITGVRVDYFDLQFHNNHNDQDLRRIDRLVTPRIGLIYQASRDVSVYANYSVAYLPSSGDQFSSLTSITQQVKPEKFTNYEIGAKWDVRQNLLVTMALYRQDRTNTRAIDPNDPTRILQTGRQRTNGFELEVNGKLTRNWTIAGGYAYQDAFISSATISARTGAQVALVPRQSFSLWNNYKLLSKLGFGLGVINRSDMFAAVDNLVVLPGYVRADAAVFINVNEHWRVQANLQNLFGKKYFLNADGNNNISPGSPRSSRLSIVMRF